MPVSEISDSTKSNGTAFLIAGGIVFEIVAANCSSPQTTEINAGARAKTLMKWVNIGVAQSVLFIAIAAACDDRKAAIISGGALALVIQYGCFTYAKACGLNSSEPGTEQY